VSGPRDQGVIDAVEQVTFVDIVRSTQYEAYQQGARTVVHLLHLVSDVIQVPILLLAMEVTSAVEAVRVVNSQQKHVAVD
jgi:hypothetical protein